MLTRWKLSILIGTAPRKFLGHWGTRAGREADLRHRRILDSRSCSSSWPIPWPESLLTASSRWLLWWSIQFRTSLTGQWIRIVLISTWTSSAKTCEAANPHYSWLRNQTTSSSNERTCWVLHEIWLFKTTSLRPTSMRIMHFSLSQLAIKITQKRLLQRIAILRATRLFRLIDKNSIKKPK